MTRRFCDACGQECTVGPRLTFDFLCHIGSSSLSGAYVDREGNRCSGRPESRDVCQRCYNDIYDAAFRRYTAICDAAIKAERTTP